MRENIPTHLWHMHDIAKLGGSKGHEIRSARLVKTIIPSVDSVITNAIIRHMRMTELESRYDYMLFIADKMAALDTRQQNLKKSQLDAVKLREYVNQKRTRMYSAIEKCPYSDIQVRALRRATSLLQ
jgi:HD superfamily phosphohydrolase YqeK